MAIPALPAPPDKYERRYFDELNRVLRLFFVQNDIPPVLRTARLQVLDLEQNVIIDQYLNQTTGFTEVEYEGETAGDLRIKLTNLPTSSAGLPAGTVYNDSGTLKVA